jgi:hypothetical protein
MAETIKAYSRRKGGTIMTGKKRKKKDIAK